MSPLLTLLYLALLITDRTPAGAPPEFSRASSFSSLDEFIASAKSFKPNKKPTEFAFIFSTPEYSDGFEDTVFAASIDEVKLLWRGGDGVEEHAVFALYAHPKTEHTDSEIGAIVLLENPGYGWAIYDIKREMESSLRGGVECKLTHGSNPKSRAPYPWLDGVRITIESQWSGIRAHGPLQRWTYRVDCNQFTLVHYAISDE